ncbi:MAG TPA: hybrid sensor histidine kinase/response regulator [Magnetovibrio sp.]
MSQVASNASTPIQPHDASVRVRFGSAAAKVLIVDDEPDIVEEVVEQLEDEGISCLTAFNAKSAMELVRSDADIGVVVTDIRMPGMDGLEMARQLKATLDADRDLFVIVVTGHAGMKEAVEALKLGAEDFLTKPISPDHLLHSVRRAGEMIQLRQHERSFQEQLKHEVKIKTADLNEANRKLTAANQIKDQFLSVMGHELRTPLNAINGFSVLLKDKITTDDSAAMEYLEHIMSSGQRLTETVENILEFADTVSGSRKVNMEWQVVDDLLSNVIGQCDALAKAKNTTLKLTTIPQDKLIKVDSAMTMRALNCIIDNAIKFSPSGTTVDIGAKRKENAIELYVKDSGVGMSEDEIGVARKPLSQVNSTLSRPVEGTGLGLSLAILLSEAQGGELNIESTPGTGTLVSIIIPQIQQGL